MKRSHLILIPLLLTAAGSFLWPEPAASGGASATAPAVQTVPALGEEPAAGGVLDVQDSTADVAATLPPEVQTDLARRLHEARRHFTPHDGEGGMGPGAATGVPAERLSVHMDATAITVRPWDGAWTWAVRALTGQPEIEEDRVTRTAADGTQEWLHHSTRGLEHGFTVPAPQGDGQTLQLELAFDTPLRAAAAADARSLVFTDDAGTAQLHYTGLHSFDARGRALPAAFARLTEHRWAVQVQSAGAEYPVTVDPFITRQSGDFISPQSQPYQAFGISVSASADSVAIGAPGFLTELGAGAVYVYGRGADGVWRLQTTVLPADSTAGDRFGWSVSVTGARMVVGAAGAAYAFSRNNDGTWTQRARFAGPDADSLATVALDRADTGRFAVAFSGDTPQLTLRRFPGRFNLPFLLDATLPVSRAAVRMDSGRLLLRYPAGGDGLYSAYEVLENTTGSTWAVTQTLLTLPVPGNEELLLGATLWGDELVSTIGHLETGALRMEIRRASGGSWTLTETVPLGSNLPVGLNSGSASLAKAGSLAYSGRHAAVRWVETKEEGRLEIFTRLYERRFDGTWSLASELSHGGSLPESGSQSQLILYYVMLNSGMLDLWNGRLVVGDALAPVNGALLAGRARIYEESPGAWGRSADVVPPADAPGVSVKGFGSSVAVDGDWLIAGAPLTDQTALGGTAAGAAYLYRRNGPGSPYAFVKALAGSNTVAGHRFGTAVALSGPWAAVASPGRSVYLFHRDQGGAGQWGQTQRLDKPAGFDSSYGVSLSMDGLFLAAGQPENGGGQAHLYRLGTTGQWALQKTLTNPEPLAAATDRFGAAVAVNGGRVLVGVPFGRVLSGANPVTSGLALLFEENLGGTANWGRVQQISSPFTGRTGTAVALSQSYAVALDEQSNRVHYARRTDDGTAWETGWRFSGPYAGFGNALAITSRQLFAAFSPAIVDGDSGVAAYDLRDSINSLQPVVPDGEFRGELESTGFGSALAADDDTVAAGQPFAEGGRGRVAVRHREYTEWLQTRAVSVPSSVDNAQASDRMGASVAIAGDFAWIGAPGDNDQRGAVYFVRHRGLADGAAGPVVTKITFPGSASGDLFGHAIAAAADFAFIGRPGTDLPAAINAGTVHLYRLTTLKDTETALAPSAGALLGWSVAWDGEYAVAGAPRAPVLGNQHGEVHVFRMAANDALSRDTTLFLTSPPDGARFGSSVAVQGPRIAAGAMEAGFTGTSTAAGTGAVWVFDRSPAGTWSAGTRVAPPAEMESSVAVLGAGAGCGLSGDTLVMGSADADGRGWLWFYERQPDNSWALRHTGHSDIPGEQLRGGSLRVRGSQCLVAAGADNATAPSAALLFRRESDGTWSRAARFTDAATAEFGAAVDVDHASLVIGAPATTGTAASAGGVRFYALSGSPFDEWTLGTFGAVSVGNPALRNTVWGPAADPDKDGIPNLLEAAFGTSPLTPGAIPWEFAGMNGDQFVVQWRESTRNPGVRIQPEFSLGLDEWTTSGMTLTRVSETTATRLLQTTVSTTGRPVNFVRLRAWIE